MKRACFPVVFILMVCAMGVVAQEPALVFKPGDTVRLMVIFKTPVSLSHGSFEFQLTGQRQNPQQEFLPYFGGNNLAESSKTEYEISGKLGENVATGEYRLHVISVKSEGVQKTYQRGKDFQSEIVIRINNPKHVLFPGIKDVTVQPSQ